VRALEELVGLLTRLPGIGRKSALRVAYHLLKADPALAEALAEKIRDLKSSVSFCSVCGSYTESDPCPVCSSPARDRSVVCVVEQPQDVLTIEASREYRGVYHVLGGLISPLDGVGPEDLRMRDLAARAGSGEVTEVVVATNPTVEGDTTALYVKRLLEPTGVAVTRLATGIPVGGDLEYADRLTLARSFRGRTKL
jgi:recombination protein RecR